jgi:hypothetical protein
VDVIGVLRTYDDTIRVERIAIAGPQPVDISEARIADIEDFRGNELHTESVVLKPALVNGGKSTRLLNGRVLIEQAW